MTRIARRLLSLALVLQFAVAAAPAAEDPPPPPAPPPVEAPAPATSVPSAEKVVLRYRVKKDEVRRMKANLSTEMKQTMQGQEQVTRQEMRMGLVYRILEVAEDGSFVAECTYDSVAMKMEMMGMKVDYDSEKSSEVVPEMARPMASLLGKKLRLRMGSRGEVTAVEGVRELLDAMIEEAAGPDPAAKEALRAMMSEFFSEDTFRQMFAQNMTVLPEAPVGVGDSWKWRIDVKKPFPLGMEATMTIRERKDGRSRTTFEGVISTPEGAEPMQMGGMKMRMSFKGKQKGEMVIDEATGWCPESRIDQEFAGTMVVEIPDQDGMSIPMSCVQTVVVTVE